MKNRKRFKAAFKNTNLTLNFGDDWINIARPDGVHCEFYGSDDHLCATYTINDKETDLDFWFSDENALDSFVSTIKKILEV